MPENDLFLFVSHVAEDRAAAMEVVDELERRGVKCWIAPRNVHPGHPFDDEIVEAIEGSRAMLLVFSDRCNESEYIRREVTVAGESHKVIIPFRIEDAQPRRGLRVRLSDLHWIDAFASHERAIDELAREFGSAQAEPSIQPAPPSFRPPQPWPEPRADIPPRRRISGGLIAAAAIAGAACVGALVFAASGVFRSALPPPAPAVTSGPPAQTSAPPAPAPQPQPVSRSTVAPPAPPATPETITASRTLASHTEPVTSVAFSPDGRVLASAGRDNLIILWDAASGKELRRLTGHTDAVNAVAFSPDGLTLASGGGDATVRVWSVVEGQVIRKLTGHTAGIMSLAYSGDAKTLASAGLDGTVRIWDARQGTLLHSLSDQLRSAFSSVAISPDGRSLVAGSWNGSIRIWDLATVSPIRTLSGHHEQVNAVAVSPDSRIIASASGAAYSGSKQPDDTVRLWDAATGDLRHTLTGHTNQVNAVAFSPDGRIVASGSSDSTIRLWDAASGKMLRVLELNALVLSVAFSPDGRTLASGNVDNTIQMWSLPTPTADAH